VIRVLIAAASAVVRAGLEALLGASPDCAVIGSTREVAQLVAEVDRLQPEVVLVALDGGEDDLLSELAARADSAPAVVLLAPEATALAPEALRTGVRAVLGADAAAPEILAAVQAVAAGLTVLHPEVLEGLLSSLPPPAIRPLPATQTLTPRELEVLAMLAEGLGNKIIARRLAISEHTVKFHLGSIFGKLGVSSRTEAVTLGARQGLIML
jgi:DNA-binding NarL/FixJ family response regulator